MLRSAAVARIARGLGFRTGLDAVIVDALQEAQRLMESGTTLPTFMLWEDVELVLPAGDSWVYFPDDFISIKDDQRLHYTPEGRITPVFLRPKFYEDAVVAQLRSTTEPRLPTVYVLRDTSIDFINSYTSAISFTWSYYAHDYLLDTNIENTWLLEAPDWLIGEAGLIVARDLRDKEAIAIFEGMRVKGRTAAFTQTVMNEDMESPRAMGANQ